MQNYNTKELVLKSFCDSCLFVIILLIYRIGILCKMEDLSSFFARKIFSIVQAKYEIDDFDVIIEKPKEKNFGDFSTNIAMVLCKRLRVPPTKLAEEIVNSLISDNSFKSLSTAGSGFINWFVSDDLLREQLLFVLSDEFHDKKARNGKKINIEYVSANPTGPLHAGHARGAIVGDSLARILDYVGYDVTKEYYINDAGNQIVNLARSLCYRYAQILDKKFGNSTVPNETPEGMYPGDYIIEMAENLVKEYGDKFYQKPEEEWLSFFSDYAVNFQMEIIKRDLLALDIKHDVFTSEKDIVNKGAVDECIEFLKDKNLVYYGKLPKPKGKLLDDWEEREQLLFKSSEFGDDVDRPLKKSDGTWTYFATDIAYHRDKIERGYDELIDFWGADHGGYIKRMSSAIHALTGRNDVFSVKICQLVKFMDGDKEVKMSKRAGTFITVRDVIEKVGKDVVRFIMLTRKDDAYLDFDFDKVIEQSKDNPVFYVQYALARTYSVLKQFLEVFGLTEIPDLAKANFKLINSEQEFCLIKELADWNNQAEIAAKLREPHRISFYLYSVASSFHSLWNSGKAEHRLRFVNETNYEASLAKLALVIATQKTIETGLNVVGVTPVKEL